MPLPFLTFDWSTVNATYFNFEEDSLSRWIGRRWFALLNAFLYCWFTWLEYQNVTTLSVPFRTKFTSRWESIDVISYIAVIHFTLFPNHFIWYECHTDIVIADVYIHSVKNIRAMNNRITLDHFRIVWYFSQCWDYWKFSLPWSSQIKQFCLGFLYTDKWLFFVLLDLGSHYHLCSLDKTKYIFYV